MNTKRVGLIAMSASIMAIGIGAVGADCDGEGGGIVGDTQTSSTVYEAGSTGTVSSSSDSQSGVGVNSASGVGGAGVTTANGVTASTGAPDGSSVGGFGEDIISGSSISTGTSGMANNERRADQDPAAAPPTNAANEVIDATNQASAMTNNARAVANQAVEANNQNAAADNQANVARDEVEGTRENVANTTLADSSPANAISARQSVLPQTQRTIADSSGLVTGLALGAAYAQQQAQLANGLGQSVVILQTCEGTPADEVIKADIIGNFQPAATQVTVGDVVRFEPAGLTGIRSLYGDYQTSTGEITCLTFNRPGTYRFDGSTNELAKGTITVFAK